MDEFDTDLPQDTETTETPTPEDVTPETGAPETETETTPEQAAPAEPVWLQQLASTMSQTAELQRQEVERRAAEDRQRQEEANRPRPLMEREAWVQELADVAGRASFDPQAALRFAQMQGELADERAEARMQQFAARELAPLRAEMQAGTVLQQAAEQAVQSAPGFLKAEDFTRAAEELFGGNRAQVAMLLSPQNPNAAAIRQQISTYAVGQALMSGRIAQPTPKPAPASPRSAARTATPGQPTNEITDPKTVQATLDSLFS